MSGRGRLTTTAGCKSALKAERGLRWRRRVWPEPIRRRELAEPVRRRQAPRIEGARQVRCRIVAPKLRRDGCAIAGNVASILRRR